MKYSLRTLLIVLTLAPPVIAWNVCHPAVLVGVVILLSPLFAGLVLVWLDFSDNSFKRRFG